jgi:S-formylglutathione hydrolase FrmB
VLKRPPALDGRIVVLEHTSKVLADNPLGDPHVRRFPVWLPPHYDRGRARRFPVVYDLTGFTGSGWAHVSWRNFDESVPEQAERLIAERRMGPMIIVFPDCFTSLGGNQYINSSAVGRYADYLTRELIPFIDGELRTLATRDPRGCFGKSSGGYGAIIHGMKYAKYWGAVADHSGDAYFDFVYRGDWPKALNELAKYRTPARKAGRYDVARATARLKPGLDDGRIRRFLDHVQGEKNPSHDEVMALMLLAMAATYDPAPSAPNGFKVPFDLETGTLIEARWRRWLAHDPIHLVRDHRDQLKTLKAIFIDCGWRDQFNIHYGARRLSQQLTRYGIRHVYEEFDDTHSAIDYRMDVSLPFLYRALRG